MGNSGIIWQGTLTNGPVGAINGGGFITSTFSNQGVINMSNQLIISKNFTNTGTINLSAI